MADSAGLAERVTQLTEFLKGIDTSHDWAPADAVALLDEVTAIYPTLPGWAESGGRFSPGGPIRSGLPLPAELAGAAWGQPAANGLRAAWVLEPGGASYPLGTSLRARIVFHNSGTKTVVFRTADWHQYANHAARDAKGKAIPISATEWTRLVTLETIRLAPGEYAEAEAHGIGIGPHNRQEVPWADIRVGRGSRRRPGMKSPFSRALWRPAAIAGLPRESGRRRRRCLVRGSRNGAAGDVSIVVRPCLLEIERRGWLVIEGLCPARTARV